MAALPPSAFADLLAGLDREAFAAFLEDLWEARGREVRIEDGVLIDDRGSYLIVHRSSRWRRRPLPSIEGRDVDGIVTNRRVASPPSDARVIDADDLRGMALYAVDRETRRGLFDRHFGRPPTATERPWEGWLSAAITRGVPVAVVVVVVAAAAVALGGLPGGVGPSAIGTPAPADTPRSTPTPTGFVAPASTAFPNSPTPSSLATETPPSPGSVLLRFYGTGDQDGNEPVSAPFETEGGVAIVEFTPPTGGGFFAVWIVQADGTRRWLAGGNGRERFQALVDLPRGRHRLFVQAAQGWEATVRDSRPPGDPNRSDTAGRGPIEYAGPLTFPGPTLVTLHGIDPNASYRATLTGRQGNARTVVINHTGSSDTVTTFVNYDGVGFVRMNATGRWTMVIRQAEGRELSGRGDD